MFAIKLARNRIPQSIRNLFPHLCTPDAVRNLLMHIDHPNCCMMYDTFHAHIEEKDVADAIRSCAKHLDSCPHLRE